MVRRNPHMIYRRPPVRFGPRRFYSVHPFFFHPFHPFFWGPAWHPWGFHVVVMPPTVVVIHVHSQPFHYDQGVFFAPDNEGFTVVPAPIGATISTIPPGFETVVIDQTTNNYYYGGTFYEKTDEGYTVVPPTAGSVVEHLSEGGEEVKIGDITYVRFGETYYQPIQQDGKNMYEIVDIREDDDE